MSYLISPHTRRAFREAFVGFTLREIGDFFEDAGIRHSDLPAHKLPSGQRRSLVEGYYASINWIDSDDINKVISVYQALLTDLPSDLDLRRKLIEYLQADGWEYEGSQIKRTTNAWTAERETASRRTSNAKPCPIHPDCAEWREINEYYSDANVFVAIPYSGYAYEDVIKETLYQAGLTPLLAKDRIESALLLCKVCKTFRKCKYGIVDLTGGNVNVAYELGLMQSLGMNCAILLAAGASRQSDLQGIENVVYRAHPKHLQWKLSKWLIDNIPEAEHQSLEQFLLKISPEVVD